MANDKPTRVADVVVNATRIAVSKYVAIENNRRHEMLMWQENPELPSPIPLPCAPLNPTNSEELEDAILILASTLAQQIIELMEANPGKEFGSIITVDEDGRLTAQSFEMPTDHRTALNVAGIYHEQVVAMIHGHPKQPVNYPRPLYSSDYPGYALMPSPRTVETDENGAETEYGDWVSYQYWVDQIALAGGNPDIFRQYIVGYGAHQRMTRPKWHLVEPNASTRWTSEDYLQDPNGKKPSPSLPIGMAVEVCPE